MAENKQEAVQAILLLGSNIGNSKDTILAAIYQLDTMPQITLLEHSRLFYTQPWGMPLKTQWFVNAAVFIKTLLSPLALLETLQEVERRFGRTRTHSKSSYQPRTLDIDIIDYNGLILQTPQLVLPHPLAHKRRFVLTAIADILPEWQHPIFGLTAEKLLKLCKDNSEVKPIKTQ